MPYESWIQFCSRRWRDRWVSLLRRRPRTRRGSKAARKQLRALGFKDDAVNRAVEKLQPRRSHKEEIQAIVMRLGLAADGDIARAWISIAQAHGEAHRRDL